MPWPVPKEVAVALKIPGFNPMDDLSRYMLKVTKLTAPKYSVAIDDKEIGTYTREELAAGVNLSFPALEAMPETGKLLGDIHTQTRIFFNRWRNVQLGAPPKADTPEAAEAARQEELKKQDALLAEMDAKLNQPRTPPAHRWTLLPVN